MKWWLCPTIEATDWLMMTDIEEDHKCFSEILFQYAKKPNVPSSTNEFEDPRGNEGAAEKKKRKITKRNNIKMRNNSFSAALLEGG